MNRKQPRASANRNTTAADGLAELYSAALAQQQAGALAEAGHRYREILARFPDHADSLHNLGLIAIRKGDAASAADLIGRAIAINDQLADYHFSIAAAFRALKRMDEVAAHLERTIELRGDHALAHLNLGNMRREQGRMADALVCYERALAIHPNLAAAHFNLAEVLFEQGQLDPAVSSFRQALALEPNRAATHSRLGAVLIRQNRAIEAMAHLEQALALQPDLFEAHGNLAQAALWMGQGERAIEAASRAVELKETPQSRTLFAHCISLARFSSDNGRFRRLLLRAFAGGWMRPRELTAVSIGLIKLNSVVKDAIPRVEAIWPTRLPAGEMSGAGMIAALAQDELLCRLLESDPIADIGIERLLTNVRGALLQEAMTGAANDERLLGFYCSLARQCFINDYVYTTTESETGLLATLRCSLEQTLAAGAPPPALTVAAVSAYLALHTIPHAEALLAQSWPEPIAAVIDQQVKEPMEERRIGPTVSILTGIDDAVSRAVREQYEESPYPRWTRSGPPALPFGLPPQQLGDALIAGCGTGLSAIEFAGSGARLLAIDLSLASLSYAKRMAQKFGLTNIEFAQADIMRLGSLGRQFDFINASGVLHHLADPWEGWRILLSLLRPGGTMEIGLYSERARRNVVAARALIAARGYKPNAEDIRRCREEIIAASDPLLNSISRGGDFFTIAECRDLLFHVQECRTTLPEIKSFLVANGLQFGGFFLDALTHHRFSARFPQPGAGLDLDCWHAFESEVPATFAAMYQFAVAKPAAPSATPR